MLPESWGFPARHFGMKDGAEHAETRVGQDAASLIETLAVGNSVLPL